jgi:hypothetical protein
MQVKWFVLVHYNWAALYFQIPAPDWVCTRVVIGFVDSEAAAGNYTLDPFNFQHFSLRQITLKLNQVPVSVFSTFWKTASTEQVPCFIRFRYDPFSIKFGSTSKQYKDKTRNLLRGSSFPKSTKKATTCVVYAEYPSYFEINLEKRCNLRINTYQLKCAWTCLLFGPLNSI